MTDTQIVASTETAHGAYRVRLKYDPDAPDPRRDYDHAGTLLLRIRGRDCPLEGDLVAQIDAATDRGGFRLAAAYLRIVHRVPVVLPVWGYDHGGLAVAADDRTSEHADPWDSGPAGLIYITPRAGRRRLDRAGPRRHGRRTGRRAARRGRRVRRLARRRGVRLHRRARHRRRRR